jgi:hypothetical protein
LLSLILYLDLQFFLLLDLTLVILQPVFTMICIIFAIVMLNLSLVWVLRQKIAFSRFCILIEMICIRAIFALVLIKLVHFLKTF